MTPAHTDTDAIDAQYTPVYEFDHENRDVICNVPRSAQIDALAGLAGEGAVEPDGWTEGYNHTTIPVVDGVPLTVLDNGASTQVAGSTEGAESWTEYAVDSSLGTVELHHAGRHPSNVSKLKVNENTEDN